MININGEEGSVVVKGKLVDLLSEFATIAISLAEDMANEDISPDKIFSQRAFAATVMSMFENDETGIIKQAVKKAIDAYEDYEEFKNISEGKVMEKESVETLRISQKRYRR